MRSARRPQRVTSASTPVRTYPRVHKTLGRGMWRAPMLCGVAMPSRVLIAGYMRYRKRGSTPSQTRAV
eukprot:scaffold74475_cov32-Tisochrysis_lutea.AAC.8